MCKISVIMSVYNEREEYLRAAIESILSQTYADFEFIVVNDEPGNEIIDKVAFEYMNKDSRVVYIQNSENMGPAFARNRAIEKAAGEYVAVMDSDDIAYPTRLEREYKYMTESGFDFISACHNETDADGKVITEGRALAYNASQTKALLRWTDIAVHPLWLVKREVYTKLNGYRNVKSAEDYDFVLRAVNAGFSVGICGEILLDYRINKRGISQNNTLRQFLILKYLASHMDSVNTLDINAAERYVEKRVNKKRADAYVRAKEYIRTASKANPFKTLIYITKAVFTSRYAPLYLYYTLRARALRKKNNRS